MPVPALEHLNAPAPVRQGWGRRRWVAALVGAGATALAIGVPTDVIPNPVFGRPVSVTWWSVPVLVVTSVLAGLLLATYVTEGQADEPVDRPARAGGFAGLLAFFAVGCPVCNKLVVLALGATGAVEVFAPLQPLLAMLSVGLLAGALQRRLTRQRSCPVDTR